MVIIIAHGQQIKDIVFLLLLCSRLCCLLTWRLLSIIRFFLRLRYSSYLLSSSVTVHSPLLFCKHIYKYSLISCCLQFTPPGTVGEEPLLKRFSGNRFAVYCLRTPTVQNIRRSLSSSRSAPHGTGIFCRSVRSRYSRRRFSQDSCNDLWPGHPRPETGRNTY